MDAAGKEIGQAEFPDKTYKFIGGDPLENGWKICAHGVPKDGKREMPGSKKGVPVMKMATFAGPYVKRDQNRNAAHELRSSLRQFQHRRLRPFHKT